MPKETVALTELELQILGIFVQKKIMVDKEIADVLERLVEKLRK